MFDKDLFLKEATALNVVVLPPAETGLTQPLYIREMTAKQREHLQAMSDVTVMKDGSTKIDMSKSKGATVYMIGSCMVTDETGKTAVFRNVNDPEIKRISGKLADVITKKIREISGLTETAKDEAKNE